MGAQVLITKSWYNAFDRRGGAGRRVCPACLLEHRHHRAIWDLMFIAACPVHAVCLVDACRTCGSALRWAGGSLTRCACLSDLTQVAAKPTPKADLRGTKAVHGLLLGDDRFEKQANHAMSLEPFQDLGPGKIVEFLFRIGLELVAARPKVFSLEQPGELAWEAHVALNHGLELAQRWPAAFHEALEMMRMRSAPEFVHHPSAIGWRCGTLACRVARRVGHGHPLGHCRLPGSGAGQASRQAPSPVTVCWPLV